MLESTVMEEVGVVISIDGVMAKVSVPRKSVCEGCSSTACKPGEQSMEIEALNKINADVGQKVKIITKNYTYLKGAIFVYGIPALALLFGAILGKDLFSGKIKGLDPETVSAIFGFAAFAIAFIAVKLWSIKFGKRTESMPVIEEILNG